MTTAQDQKLIDYEAARSRFPAFLDRLDQLVGAGMPIASATTLLDAEIRTGVLNERARGHWAKPPGAGQYPAAPALAGSFGHRASSDDGGKGDEGESWEDWCRRMRKVLADNSTPAAEKRRIRRAIAAGEADEAATTTAASTLSVAELQAIAIAARAAADQYQQAASYAPTAATDPKQAELDRIFGIQPAGMVMGSRVRGAVQEFGIMVPAPPATAKQAAPRAVSAAPAMPAPSPGLTAAQARKLDEAFGDGSGPKTGTRVVNGVQQFGI